MLIFFIFFYFFFFTFFRIFYILVNMKPQIWYNKSNKYLYYTKGENEYQSLITNIGIYNINDNKFYYNGNWIDTFSRMQMQSAKLIGNPNGSMVLYKFLFPTDKTGLFWLYFDDDDDSYNVSMLAFAVKDVFNEFNLFPAISFIDRITTLNGFVYSF